jgi:hypothetical protein
MVRFRMMAAVLWALWMFTAQSAALSDPVLDRTRERMLADARRLKHFTCRQTVKRVDTGKKAIAHRNCSELIREHEVRHSDLPLRAWDRLRLDVAIADGKEMYSWAGAPKFEDDEIRKIAAYGAFGTGDFGPFLISIFGGSAKIRFIGERTVSGRRLREYSYEVPLERSQYAVRTPNGKPVTVAHHGSFLLDPKLNDITRLEVESEELPEQTENCQAISEIRYGRMMIGSTNMLIPRESSFRVIQHEGGETLNTTVYAGCREYVGESTVHFDETDSTEQEVREAPGQQPIPAGLPFEARLLTSIDTDTAAAGDPVDGILTSPIADEAGLVFAPAGSRVRGRLLQVAGSLYQVQIKLRLESVDLKGFVPISANNIARFRGRRIVLKNYQAAWLTSEN